jgi:hypothetical protein
MSVSITRCQPPTHTDTHCTCSCDLLTGMVAPGSNKQANEQTNKLRSGWLAYNSPRENSLREIVLNSYYNHCSGKVAPGSNVCKKGHCLTHLLGGCPTFSAWHLMFNAYLSLRFSGWPRRVRGPNRPNGLLGLVISRAHLKSKGSDASPANSFASAFVCFLCRASWVCVWGRCLLLVYNFRGQTGETL